MVERSDQFEFGRTQEKILTHAAKVVLVEHHMTLSGVHANARPAEGDECARYVERGGFSLGWHLNVDFGPVGERYPIVSVPVRYIPLQTSYTSTSVLVVYEDDRWKLCLEPDTDKRRKTHPNIVALQKKHHIPDDPEMRGIDEATAVEIIQEVARMFLAAK